MRAQQPGRLWQFAIAPRPRCVPEKLMRFTQRLDRFSSEAAIPRARGAASRGYLGPRWTNARHCP